MEATPIECSRVTAPASPLCHRLSGRRASSSRCPMACRRRYFANAMVVAYEPVLAGGRRLRDCARAALRRAGSCRMRHAPQPRCAYLLACLLLATIALAGDPATGRERQSGPKPYPATVDQWPGVGVVRVFDWMPSRRSAFWRERETVGPGSVVFVGDSLTEGWRSLAADFPGLNIANRGIGGDVSRGCSVSRKMS